MPRRQVSVRLNETELAQVDVMAFKGSREQCFRDMIRASARRLEPILEAAISGFVEAARAAHEDGGRGKGRGVQAAHRRVRGRPCNSAARGRVMTTPKRNTLEATSPRVFQALWRDRRQ